MAKNKRKKTQQRPELASVRAAARQRDIDAGLPNCSYRFSTPTDKYKARGRSWKGEY